MGGVTSKVKPDLMSRLALSIAFEPADEALGLAVHEYGAEAVVAGFGSGRVADLNLSSHRPRWRERDWVADAASECAEAQEAGIRFLTPSDDGWPQQLDDLDGRAPLVLRTRGPLDLAEATSHCVAIVGARSATRYGVWVAEELAANAAHAGFCVVSGGAFGIDAAAHRGALAADGATVIVTAAGVDRATPVSNSNVFDKVAQSGLVISETRVGSRPSRHRFLIRNRLIAALAPLTLVVEAAARSGALATGRDADALGRIVAAVPGPITSAMSVGSNELLKSGGASVVTSAADIVGLLSAGHSLGGSPG